MGAPNSFARHALQLGRPFVSQDLVDVDRDLDAALQLGHRLNVPGSFARAEIRGASTSSPFTLKTAAQQASGYRPRGGLSRGEQREERKSEGSRVQKGHANPRGGVRGAIPEKMDYFCGEESSS